MNPLRIIAAVYAVLFAVVTSLNYIPGLTDAQGRTFGLFALDIFDDALHAASGLWAALAAWTSTRATLIYFRVFGPLYCLDGVLDLPLMTRVLMNLPHIAIGGFAAFAGYVLPRIWSRAAADRR